MNHMTKRKKYHSKFFTQPVNPIPEKHNHPRLKNINLITIGVLSVLTLSGCSGGGSDSSSGGQPIPSGSSTPAILNLSTTLTLKSNQPLTLFPEQNAILTIENTGSLTAKNIQLSSTLNNLSFSPSEISNLAPNATATVNLFVHSSNTGSTAGDTVSVQAENSNAVSLPITVIPLRFSEDQIQIGSGDTTSFTLKNQGSQPIQTMNLSVSTPITTTSDTTCAVSLAPQNSCQYIFTAPDSAISQTGSLSFSADGASFNNKPISILRPTYEINVIQAQIGLSNLIQNANQLSQIEINPSEKTVIQIVNNSPVMIKNLQITLPEISNVFFNNLCAMGSPPYNLAANDSCILEIEPNDQVLQGDQGALSFSTDNADTSNANYQVMVSSEVPSTPKITNFSLQSNSLIGSSGVNYPVIAFISSQNNKSPLPLNLSISNGTASCTLTTLNTRHACGWEINQYQCNQNNTECMIEMSYTIPPTSQRTEESFTFLFNHQLPQTLLLAEMPNFYLFPKDTQSVFNILPTNQILDIKADGAGSIYLGTVTGLLYSHDQGQSWKWFSTNDGLPFFLVQNIFLEGNDFYLSNFSHLVQAKIQQENLIIQNSYAAPYERPNSEKVFLLNGKLYVITVDAGGYWLDSNNQWQGFPDIVRDSFNIPNGTQQFRDFFIGKDGLIYLSSDFGLDTYSPDSQEISERSSSVSPLHQISGDENNLVVTREGYAGYSEVFLSHDSGLTFENINTLDEITDTPKVMRFNPVFSEIAVGTNAGLLLSKDQGKSWKTAPGTEALSIESIYVDSNGLYYLSTSTGISFQSEPQGSFTTLNGSTIGNAVNDEELYASPLNLYLFKGPLIFPLGQIRDPLKNLFISDDRGVTFNKSGLPTISSKAGSTLFIATDPISLQDHLLVSSGSQGAFISDDQGKTWSNFTQENSSLPSNKINDGAMCTPTPANYRTLLLGTDKGLAISNDNGQSWRTVLANENIAHVAYLSSDCQRIAVNSGDHITISFDNGATWPVESPSNISLNSLITDKNGNLISRGPMIDSPLVLGIKDTENSAQYTWKVIDSKTAGLPSSTWWNPRIVNDRVYLLQSSSLMSISLNTLIQNPSIQASDWITRELPMKFNISSIIPNPSMQSMQVFGLAHDGTIGSSAGLNLPIDSDQEDDSN